MKRILTAPLALVLLLWPALSAAAEKFEVFPTVRYDQYIIYESLALFWVGIVGLLVIIRMKLKEIERVQKLRLQETEENIPSLE